VDAAAALQARVGLARVGDEAVETGAQEGAESRTGRVEAGEEVLLERPRKKTLRQIGGVLRRRVPFEAHVLEDRLPVGGDQRVERRAPLIGPRAAHRGHDRVPGRRESGHGQADSNALATITE